jgi:hypothetical protein
MCTTGDGELRLRGENEGLALNREPAFTTNKIRRE